jgi:DNA-binding LacI/PurR family transcriptional regulator
VISLGHRRIGFISGPLTLKSARTRRSAFLSCFREFGIADAHRTVIEGNHRIDGGQNSTRQMLSQPKPPTAVLTSNDLTAIGTLYAITSSGLRVPEDISVIGFDDIEMSQFTHPPLTTVRLSRQELGKRAFDALYQAVEDLEADGQEIKVSTELLLRGSTGPVRPGGI